MPKLFMITLNLVPTGQKESYKKEKIYIALKEAATLIFLFSAIMSIMLFVSRYYLEQQLADLLTANAANVKTNKLTNSKINAVNSDIKNADNIQKNFLAWRPLMENISNLIPENISLSAINIYRQQATVELIGTAKSRDDLSAFKNKLGQTPWIKNVDLPINSLIDKVDNKFDIKMGIDTSKLTDL